MKNSIKIREIIDESDFNAIYSELLSDLSKTSSYINSYGYDIKQAIRGICGYDNSIEKIALIGIKDRVFVCILVCDELSV